MLHKTKFKNKTQQKKQTYMLKSAINFVFITLYYSLVEWRKKSLNFFSIPTVNLNALYHKINLNKIKCIIREINFIFNRIPYKTFQWTSTLTWLNTFNSLKWILHFIINYAPRESLEIVIFFFFFSHPTNGKNQRKKFVKSNRLVHCNFSVSVWLNLGNGEYFFSSSCGRIETTIKRVYIYIVLLLF